jgi:hypothetical protein
MEIQFTGSGDNWVMIFRRIRRYPQGLIKVKNKIHGIISFKTAREKMWEKFRLYTGLKMDQGGVKKRKNAKKVILKAFTGINPQW